MKTGLKIVALTLGLSAFAAAHAEWGPYAGISASQLRYQKDGFPTAEPTTLALRIGNQFNRYFAVEARLGAGISNSTISAHGTPLTLTVDHLYGIYAKGIIPVTSWFAPYGMVGATHASLTTSTGVFKSSVAGGDISYGLGADFAVSRKISLNLEAARLSSGRGSKVDAVSLDIAYKF
jgi:opacity protein-like surface antigen